MATQFIHYIYTNPTNHSKRLLNEVPVRNVNLRKQFFEYDCTNLSNAIIQEV